MNAAASLPPIGLKEFEHLYSKLTILQHPEVVLATPSKFGQMQAVMPLVLGLGKQAYSCRDIYHSGRTCRQFLLNKLKMSLLNGLKVFFFASYLPFMIKKRNELMSLDLKRIIKVIMEAALDCLRGASFVMLGNSVPFIILCYYPFTSWPIKNLPMTKKMPLVYTSMASLTLIAEDPVRMPAYVGFFVSKGLSIAFRLLQARKLAPSHVPFENVLAVALIAGLIGYISVKKSKLKAKEKKKIEVEFLMG